MAPLVEAGCILTFVASLAPFVPATVRHPAALALLNVSVHDCYKAQVTEVGGVEAAVYLLGSDDPEVCIQRIEDNKRFVTEIRQSTVHGARTEGW